MYRLILSTAMIFVILSCSKIKNSAKDAINTSGEIVGESAAEFAEGIADGVEKTLESKIELSNVLKEKGVETGAYEATQNNQLSIYLIFNKDFEGYISAKAINEQEKEIGRCKLQVEAPKDSAGYYKFDLPAEAKIEMKSKIYLF